MYRARFETLENRTMFSANPLVDLSATLEAQPAAAEYGKVEDAPTESFSLNFEEIKVKWEIVARTETIGKDWGDGVAQTESVAKNEKITIGGNRTESVAFGDVGLNGRPDDRDLAVGVVHDFNGDGRLDVVADRNQDIEVENDEKHFADVGSDGFLTTDPQGPTHLPFQGTGPTGLIIPGPHGLLNSGDYRFSRAASLLASDEYFARFSGTKLDDEVVSQRSNNRWGGGPLQASEDKMGAYEIQDLMLKTSSSSRIVTGVGAGGGPH